MRKWLITMVSCCPLNGVIPLRNGLSMAYQWRLLTTYESWEPILQVGGGCRNQLVGVGKGG